METFSCPSQDVILVVECGKCLRTHMVGVQKSTKIRANCPFQFTCSQLRLQQDQNSLMMRRIVFNSKAHDILPGERLRRCSESHVLMRLRVSDNVSCDSASLAIYPL